MIDCLGVCGGTANLDCLGVCDGDATVDICGECNGNGDSCEQLEGHLNQETGWNFYQSTEISFYGFQSILIDGSTAIGDGWAPSSNTGPGDSTCLDNPFTCDVVGAFLNGVCVGWVYADSDGQTTVPVMGLDTSSYASTQQTQSYCTTEDTPTFLIYSSQDQQTYLLESSVDYDLWQSNEFYVYDLAFNSDASYGCTNSNAVNHDPNANIDNGSCVIYGCTDPNADNYNPIANHDDGSCFTTVYGCIDPTAQNYDPNANTYDDSCCYGDGCA